MDHNILYIIGTFFISMGCGFVAIPLIVKFCKKKNCMTILTSGKCTSAVYLGSEAFVSFRACSYRAS